MKRIFLFTGIILIVLTQSCKQTTDKKAELQRMIKERDELSAKIAALEKELNDSAGGNETKTKVSYLETQKTVFSHYIEVQGKVDGEQNVIATAQVPGIITKVYVKEGDVVKKGQTLAELDASVLYQNLKDIESSLSFVTELYEKQKRLWEQKIGSEVQYLTAKNNKESIEHKIKTLKEQIAMYRVEAPIDGSVEEAPLKVGQAVAPGLVCFRVVNFSSVKVMAEVSEAFSPKIKQGNDVIISFPDFKVNLNSKISFTSRYINPINRTFTVEVRLSSSDTLEFRANMISVLKIEDYKNQEAIVLPVNAIQEDGSGSFVFTAVSEGGKNIVRKKAVVQGLNYNGMVEIKEGITLGEKIITSPIQDIEDGMTIELIN